MPLFLPIQWLSWLAGSGVKRFFFNVHRRFFTLSSFFMRCRAEPWNAASFFSRAARAHFGGGLQPMTQAILGRYPFPPEKTRIGLRRCMESPSSVPPPLVPTLRRLDYRQLFPGAGFSIYQHPGGNSCLAARFAACPGSSELVPSESWHGEV